MLGWITLAVVIYVAVTAFLLHGTNRNNGVAVVGQLLWPIFGIPFLIYLIVDGVVMQLTQWKHELSMWLNSIDDEGEL